ncbi:MAG: RluA family pseudouridine synthase [Alphaproteobacteria bacterium]
MANDPDSEGENLEGEKSKGESVAVTAAPEDEGDRLDAVIARRHGALSRTRAQSLIHAEHVTTGGRTVSEADYRVKGGQIFAIFVPDSTPASPKPEAIALAVLYEDEHLIVIDKPAGLVVHPAPGHQEGTLVNALLAHCGPSLTGIGGVRRPGIVHRLDKDTSGVMVAAKTDAAYAGLQAQFAAHSATRRYVTVVWGVPVPRAGEISGAIGRNPRNRKKMAVVTRGGKAALTRYRVERRFSGGIASLLSCQLATGRTHQIRVHLAAKGHPVIGDPLYGAPAGKRKRLPPGAAQEAAALGRQALHAQILGFRHPTTGKDLSFSSELPCDIGQLVDFLESI